MVITSVNNNKIKDINKLKDKKYRDSSNSFLVEGEHLVIEAYREDLIKELIVLDDSDFILDGIPTIKVSSEVMKKLSSMDSYPSVIGVANKIKEKELGDSILMLDDIQDPGNLGTIIRSSAAFGIDTIVVSPKTVDIYNIKDYELNEMVSNSILDIQLDCLDRNRGKLMRDLNKLVRTLKTNTRVNGVAVPRNKRYEENNDIANYLLRQTRKQDMISSAEIKIIRDSIKKCMKCYYLYLFILEYTRVEKLSNDTRFFNNFKSGIEYGNQTKG